MAPRMEPAPVSVVIPAWKSDAVLPAALRSVAAQRLPPAEIVVVDDGSPTGDPRSIALRDWGLPVRFLRTPHGGPSRARNRGVEAAGSPWIAFLDADDTWSPDKLHRQWAAARAAPPDLVMVSCDWLRPGEAGPRHAAPPVRRGAEEGVRSFLWRNRFQTSTVLVRRSAFEAAGAFRPELDGAEDWDMWMRTAARGSWIHLREPLVRYLDNPGGVSKDLLRVYATGRSMLEAYLRGEGDPRIVARVRRQHLLWHHVRFGWAFHRLGEGEHARLCYHAAWQPGQRAAAAGVVVTRLLPFVAGRALRRTGRSGA